MPLPSFDHKGELPEGVHRAAMEEVVSRFGRGTPEREAVTARLLRIYGLAKATRELERLVIFGSYVTTKPDPKDVDIVLVMRDDFQVGTYGQPARGLFDHAQAAEVFGASVFWLRPSMLILEPLENFVAYWQIKADGTRRGIVEVRG